MTRVAVGALLLLLHGGQLAGQSTLERTPNLSGGWTAPAGELDFNFVHRFNHSGGAERQVQNRPTFLLGYGLPSRVMAGVSYTTRSALTAGVPNEWEPFVRVEPLSRAAPVQLGVQLGYNEAARSADGELSLRTRVGPVQPLLAARVLSRDAGARTAAFVLAGGAVLRLRDHVALAGDVGRRWSDLDDSRAFWGAALQLRIPASPHTLSLHATNTDAATLQAASRASGTVRWGFEFTVPFTLARYFGARAADRPAAGGNTVVMRALQFDPPRLRVAAGTRVEWRNEDPVEHSITTADRSWDSGNIAPGASWSHVFDAPGTYQIVCTPHPFMKMEVIVE
jgi:plastocyanin